MLLNKEKAAGALEDHEAEREPSRQGKCLRTEAFAAGSQPARALRGQILFTGKPSHLGMDGMAFFAGKWIVFLWVRHPGPIQILLLL